MTFRRSDRASQTEKRILQKFLEKIETLFFRSSVTVQANQQLKLPMLRSKRLSGGHIRIRILKIEEKRTSATERLVARPGKGMAVKERKPQKKLDHRKSSAKNIKVLMETKLFK